MNFYEKIFLSTYSTYARTNKLNPLWSAVSALSLLHVINIISITKVSSDRIDAMGEEQFLVVFVGLTCIIFWVHYICFIKGKSMPERAKLLHSRASFWSAFTAVIYAIGTFFMLFWSIDILWDPFIIGS